MRLQNHALAEENSRLTDLTRMLLSSPHFSDVLNDLSSNGLPAQLQAAAQIPQAQHQPMVSQAPIPASVAGPQVNMAMVPDNRMDVYGAGWNSGIDMNYNPSVLAVFEVPEPVIEVEALSGKSTSLETPLEFSGSSKVEVPQLERPVVTSTILDASEDIQATEELDETDPCFALFRNEAPTSIDRPHVLFERIELGKHAQYTLVVDQASENMSESNLRDFKRLCSGMDAAYDRICRVTDYLR